MTTRQILFTYYDWIKHLECTIKKEDVEKYQLSYISYTFLVDAQFATSASSAYIVLQDISKKLRDNLKPENFERITVFLKMMEKQCFQNPK